MLKDMVLFKWQYFCFEEDHRMYCTCKLEEKRHGVPSQWRATSKRLLLQWKTVLLGAVTFLVFYLPKRRFFFFSVFVFAKVRTETSLRVEKNWTLISFTVPLEKRFVVLTLKQPRRLTKRQRHWGRRKISVDNYQQFSARAMKSWWKLKTLARAKLCTCSEFCKFLYYSLLG